MQSPPIYPTSRRYAGAAAERPGRTAVDVAQRLLAVAALGLWVAGGTWHATAEDETSRQRAADQTAGVTAGLTSPATAETMVAFYGGAPYTYPSAVSLEDKPKATVFTVDPVAWRGEPFNDPIYYGVRVVRWLDGGRTGGMLDFTHSKALAELANEARFNGTLAGQPLPATSKLSDVYRRLEFSHGHNMLTLNGLMRLVDLHPRLSLYGGIGAGINLPHTEIQLVKGGPRTYEYQYTGPVGQVVLGFEFRLPRLSYFIEYKFSLAAYDAPLTELNGTKIGLFADLYRQAARWWSGEPPPGGHLTTRLTSHQVIGGLGVRFATRPTLAP
ncbi:MAG: hypothetical protein NW217_02380 [Hyphomicrobiaceae bacterium]|nr:hypothetical protein [Hyphomicrobiaceae bacterium]